MAVDIGRVPTAHVLPPERRALRAELSVRGALVETRAQYVTTIRGLARAAGVLLPTCSTDQFSARFASIPLDEATRSLVAPLVTTMSTLEAEIRRVEERLLGLAERDVTIGLCATVPGVGLIVASAFVSVIDEAKRFRSAHAVEAYLGLAPSEATTGGPTLGYCERPLEPGPVPWNVQGQSRLKSPLLCPLPGHSKPRRPALGAGPRA